MLKQQLDIADNVTAVKRTANDMFLPSDTNYSSNCLLWSKYQQKKELNLNNSLPRKTTK